jgi:hypothetical protein
VAYTVPDSELLPTPAAQDFIYYSRKPTASFGPPAERKSARPNLVAASKLAPKPGPIRIFGLPKDPGPAARPPRPMGHQLSVTKPTASAADVLRLGLR